MESNNPESYFAVSSPHALVQAIGYLKYEANKLGLAVYVRGQSGLYGTLQPGLYRGISDQKAQVERHKALNAAIDSLVDRNPTFRDVDEDVREPLAQHYGLRTTWVDLVDNVWVALWFGCHQAYTAGEHRQYLHFERRLQNFYDEMVYLIVVAVDAESKLGAGDQTEFVDLRRSTPSIYLRPHAQHGVLFRLKWIGPRRPVDYSSRIVGRIGLTLRNGLRWLGDSAMLNVHSLFPPPSYDKGYEHLLAQTVVGAPHVGSIHHIGS